MGLEEVSVCKINQAINQAKLYNFYILTDVIYIKSLLSGISILISWQIILSSKQKFQTFSYITKVSNRTRPAVERQNPTDFASPLPLFNSAAATHIRAQGEDNLAMS